MKLSPLSWISTLHRLGLRRRYSSWAHAALRMRPHFLEALEPRTMLAGDVSINDADIAEGQTAVFTVTVANPQSSPVAVYWGTQDVTTTSSMDYNTQSGMVWFNPYETSKTISVPTIDDSIAEGTETFKVHLTSYMNANLTRADGIGTIWDNDAVTVTVQATDAQAAEQNNNNGIFTFTRSSSGAPLTVSYALSGTAVNTADYSQLSGSVTIAAGQTTASINVVPVADSLVESSETVILTLQTASSYTVGSPNSATVTIQDTNVAPQATGDVYNVSRSVLFSATAAQGVLTNDSDANGDAMTAFLVSSVSHGNLLLNPNGSFNYTPATGYIGSDSFVYKASDNLLYSSQVTVTFDVTNQTPTAVDDSYSLALNHTLQVTADGGLLANDTDLNGDALSAYLMAGPSHGALTLQSTGSFSYVPATNFVGSDTFTYRVNDDIAQGSTATVTIQVSNTAPVAADDSYALIHDQVLQLPAAGILANDLDTEDALLTAVLVSSPQHGTLTLSANGSFQYVPGVHFVGNDSFTYRADDGLLTSNLATVTLAVTNAPPVAANDTYSVQHNASLTVTGAGVLLNDSDADGDNITASLVSGPAHGALTLNASGSLLYTPTIGFVGADQFTYQVGDGLTDSASATVVLHVTDRAPLAVNDDYFVDPGQTLTIGTPGVRANDADPDGDPTTAALVNGPVHGSLSLAANGSFVYIPATGFTGSDAFRYCLNDGYLDGRIALVRIQVRLNHVPVAQGDSYAALEDGTYTLRAETGVLANDTDADGDHLIATLVSPSNHGTVRLSPDGAFVYSPTANYNGSDSFIYQASDGRSASSPVTVQISVASVNDAPQGVPDSFSVSEGNVLTVLAASGVLANDTDAEGDGLTAAIFSSPAHGTLTLAANGSFVYTPAGDFVGTDFFSYRAYDASSASLPTLVSVAVEEVNRAPVAGNNAYVVTEDEELVVSVSHGVLVDDYDPNRDALTAAVVTPPSHGTLSLGTNGSFSYLPVGNFHGTDSFTYRAADGSLHSDSATVTIHVTPVLDAPVAIFDAYMLAEDTPSSVTASGGVLGNDFDGDGDELVVRLLSEPAHGTLILQSDGGFDYVPAANFFGADAFTYVAGDGSLRSAPATVTLSILAVNDPPVAVTDSFVGSEDSPLNITASSGLLANDLDTEGDTLFTELIQAPAHGTLLLQEDGSFSYHPAANFTGSDSFTYRAGDGQLTSATTTVNLAIRPFNDTLGSAVLVTIPVGTAQFAASIGDEEAGPKDVDLYKIHLDAGQMLTADVDAFLLDSGVRYSNLDSVLRLFDSVGVMLAWNDNAADPQTSAYSADSVLKFLAAASGDFYVGVSGSRNTAYDPLVPASGFVGASGPYYLNLRFNNPPVAVPDAFTVAEDQVLGPGPATVLDNDSDLESTPLTAVIENQPLHGSLVLQPSGTFTYLPAANYSGEDYFTYRASDGELTSSAIQVSITVQPLNDAPLATVDEYEVHAGQMLTVPVSTGVLHNDFDADQDPLTSVLISGPSHGTLTLQTDGSFSYIPAPGYLGTDSFVYFSSDGTLQSAATATIRVTNHSPIAKHDRFTVFLGETLAFAAAQGLLANDTDPDGDPLTVVLESPPAAGTLTLQANGAFTLTAPSFAAQIPVEYTAHDPFGAVQTAVVTFVVTSSQVVAYDDQFTLLHDRQLIVTAGQGVLASDWQHQGQALSAQLIQGPSSGQLVLASDGSFTYTPAAGFTGNVTFRYQATSGPDSALANVVISVTNEAPTLRSREYSVIHGRTLSIPSPRGLLAFSHDGDHDALSVSVSQAPSHGTLTVGAEGSFEYSSAAGYIGQDEFTYRLFDGAAYSAPVTVGIEVTNRAPVLQADAYRVSHDLPLVVPSGIGVIANDRDQDADALTATLHTSPAHGTLAFQANGAFTYTPASNYTGTDAFSYSASDGAATGGVVTVSLNIDDGLPLPGERNYSVHQGDLLAVVAATGLLANLDDPEGDPLSAQVAVPPENGTLVLSADGSFSYEPHAGFAGRDSFSYRVSDGLVNSVPATAWVFVTNQPPQAGSNAYSVLHDQILTLGANEGILADDFDVDADALTLTVVDQPEDVGQYPLHHEFQLAPDGSLAIRPKPGFTGVIAFTYTVSDGAATTLPIPVTVEVYNTAPVAVADGYTAQHDKTLAIAKEHGLLSNDAEFDAADLVSTQLVNGVQHGTLTLNDDGSFSYTPTAGYVGQDSFWYRVSDGLAVSAAAQATLQVWNNSPVAIEDSYLIHPDQTRTVNASQGLLANDFDVDPSETLAVSLVVPVNHGTLALDPAGSFTYIPEAGYQGEDRFLYLASDGAGQSRLTTVQFHIRDERPLGSPDAFGVQEDHTLVSAASILANDSDPESDPLSAVLLHGPGYGILTLAADGHFNYVPEADFFGEDFFVYAPSDSRGTGAPVTVAITVTPINDAPLAGNLTFDLHANQLLVADLTAGASDPDSDELTAEVIAAPQHGVVTINGDATFTFSPTSGYSGSDSFTYRLSDGAAQSNTATVTLNIQNAFPHYIAPLYHAFINTPLVVNADRGIASFSSDDDGDPLVAALVTTTQHGQLTLSSDGSFTYTPDQGFTGIDQFNFTLTDGTGVVNGVAALHVDVVPILTQFESYIILHDRILSRPSSIGLLYNDWNYAGAALSAIADQAPAHGTVAIGGDGSFIYVPTTGYTGLDSFTYRATDGYYTSAPQAVYVTVTNEAPQAGPDQYETHHGQSLAIGASFGILVNDFDNDGDSFSLDLISSPAHGTLTIGSGGGFSYTPGQTAGGSDFVGTDGFAYRVFDGLLYSDPVSVPINVTNHAPVAGNDSYRVHWGKSLNISAEAGVLANDYDFNGDPLTLELVSTANQGVLTLNADGSLSYSPSIGVNGLPFVGIDSFTYRLFDGAQFSNPVTVSIDVWNSIPRGVPDFVSLPHGQTIFGNVLTNDVEWDGDTMTAQVAMPPAQGSLSLGTGGEFILTPPSNGVVFAGNLTFSYRVFDGAQASEPVQVEIEVRNLAPHAIEDYVEIDAGATAQGNVLTNDFDNDDGGNLTAILEGPGPQHRDTTPDQPPSFTLSTDGSFTYRPDKMYVGTDTFSYRVKDPTGSLSDPVTVTILVKHHPSRGIHDFYRTDFRTPITRNVKDNDLLQGSPKFKVTSPNPSSTSGTFDFSDSGLFTFRPADFFTGTVEFTYAPQDATDSDDSLAGKATTVTIVVNPPVIIAVDDVREIDAIWQTTFTPIDVVANDIIRPAGSAPGQPLLPDIRDAVKATLTIVTPPLHGDANVSNGVINYRPQAFGAGLDRITYSISLGTKPTTPMPGPATYWESQATILINSKATLLAPVDDTVTIDEDMSVVISRTSLLANDGFQGDIPTTAGVSLARLPRFGVVASENGGFRYTPNPNFFGDDSFTYAVSDPHFGPIEAQVRVTVNPVDDAPQVAGDEAVCLEDSQVTIQVLENDGNPDSPRGVFAAGSSGVTLSIVTPPLHGTASVSGETVLYTPSPNWHGDDTFLYRALKGNAVSGNASVTVHVASVNDSPTAVDDSYDVDEDWTAIFNVLINDRDDNSGVDPSQNVGALLNETIISPRFLRVEITQDPMHGTATVQANGNILYSPNPNYFGYDTLKYRFYDLDWEASDEANLSINVNSINDPPVASWDDVVYPGASSIVYEVTANDTDPEGNSLTVTSSTAEIVDSHHIRLSRTNPFQRFVSASYTIEDGQGGTSTSSLLVDFITTQGPTLPWTDPPTPGITLDDYKEFQSGMWGNPNHNVLVIYQGDGKIGVEFSNGKATITPIEGTHHTIKVKAFTGETATDLVWDGSGADLHLEATGYVDSPTHVISATHQIVVLSLRDLLASLNAPYLYADVLRDITGNLNATQDIVNVHAGWNITGTVHAGDAIGYLTAGKDLTNVISAGFAAYYVAAGHDILQTVTAPNLGEVHAGNDIHEAITATAGDIGMLFDSSNSMYMPYYSGKGGVVAGGRIWKDISAVGTIKKVIAQEIGEPGAEGSQPSIEAGDDIHWVATAGSLHASITSLHGNIYQVNAGRELDAEIRAAEGQIGFRGSSEPPAYHAHYTATPPYPMIPADPNRFPEAYVFSPTGLPPQAFGVTARANITGEIFAQTYISLVQAGAGIVDDASLWAQTSDIDSVLAGKGISAQIQAGNNLPSIVAGRDILGQIFAAHDVLLVSAGGDLKAKVTAGGKIETLSAARDIDSLEIKAYRRINSISAGRDIAGGTEESPHRITSQQDSILVVAAGRDLAGKITAELNLGDPLHPESHIAAGRKISGDLEAKVGSIVALEAGTAAELEAGTSLWKNPYTRAGEITGTTIRAAQAVGPITVSAAYTYGGSISETTITSLQSTIAAITTDGYIDAQITAKKSIAGIDAGIKNGGSLAGRVESQEGNIGHVTAHRRPSVSSGGVSLTSGGDISAPITALLDIGIVSADWNITGDLKAGLSIANIHSGNDLNAKATATLGNIGSIDVGHDLLKDVYAFLNLGNVVAGRDLGPTSVKITAFWGAIGNLTAGQRPAFGGGNIGADIYALGGIGDISALEWQSMEERSIFPDDPRFDPLQGADYQPGIRYLHLVGSTEQEATLRRFDPIAPSSQWGAAGNITGKIQAGPITDIMASTWLTPIANIGKITAYGNLGGDDPSKTITATGSIDRIWTLGDETAKITAMGSGLTVYGWGSVFGELFAEGSIQLGVFQDITGNLASFSGSVAATAWGTITSPTAAYQSVGLWAWQSAEASVSALGSVDVDSWSTIGGRYAALQTIVARMPRALKLELHTIFQPVVLGAVFEISQADISAPYIYAQSLASSITDSTFEAIMMDVLADDNITGNELIAWGGVFGTSVGFLKLVMKAEAALLGGSAGALLGKILAKKGSENVPVGSALNSISSQAASVVNALEGLASPSALEDSLNQDPAAVTSTISQAATQLSALKAALAPNQNADTYCKQLHDFITTFSGRLDEGLALLDLLQYQTFDTFFVSDETARSKTGWGNVIARNSINNTGSFGGLLDLSGLDVDGNYSAYRLEAYANQSLAGTLTTYKTAEATVNGSSSANIKSQREAIGLDAFGDVSGSLEAPSGIAVTTWGALSAQVNSQGQAHVKAYGNISGNIQGTAGVAVTTWGTLSGNVTSEASIDVFAAGTISGDITARGGVSIETGDSLTGKVKAGNGSNEGYIAKVGWQPANSSQYYPADLEVSARNNITGTIEAAHSVSLDAGGNISSNVTSKYSSIEIRGIGTVSGELIADQIVVVDALKDITSKVTVVYDPSFQDPNEPPPAPPLAGMAPLFYKGFVSLRSSENINSEVQAPNAVYATADGDVSGQFTLARFYGEVRVSALDDVTSLKIAAPNGYVSVTAASNVNVSVESGAGAAKAKTVEVTALKNIQGTIEAQDLISAEAWQNVYFFTATTTSPTSKIDVLAQGLLWGTLTSGGDLVARALGPMAGSFVAGTAVVDSPPGQNPYQNPNFNPALIPVTGAATLIAKGPAGVYVSAHSFASLSAGGPVAGSIFGGQGATILAGNTFLGDVDSNGNATLNVIEGGTFAIVSAGNDADVFTNGGVAAFITAGNVNHTDSQGQRLGDASLRTTSAALAFVEAARDVLVTTGGPIIGSLSAGRDATLLGGKPLAGIPLPSIIVAIDAGQDASVSAAGDMIGIVSAGRNADVSALSSVLASITATAGNADVLAAKGLTATVESTAANVSVLAGGNFSGSVYAGGNAFVETLGTLFAPVTAYHDTDVTVWQDSEGTITSLHGSATVAVQGSLIGNVGANQDATVLSVGNQTGSIEASHDVDFVAGANSLGTIQAGHDATLAVRGNLSASVDAGHNADVFAVGDVTGNITGGHDISLQTFGSLRDSLHAITGSIDAFVGGDTSLTAISGLDTSLELMGSSRVEVNAGQDVSVFSRLELLAAIETERNASVLGMDTVDASVTAGGNAMVAARKNLHVSVTVGGSADASTMEDLTGSLAAGVDASASAVGTISGMSILAGQDVSLIGWEPITGVIATAGWDVFVFGSEQVAVAVVAGGSAEVIAAKDLTAIVDAGQNASVTSLENVFAALVTGGDAQAVAGLDLFTSITAGGSAMAQSLGAMGAIITADVNAEAWSLGNAWALLTAGVNASAGAYGDLYVDILAGADIPLVWARGTLVGRLTAGGVVDEVWSYGEIQLDILANVVNHVVAYDAIMGTITALERIKLIESRHAIPATITAPIVEVVAPFTKTDLGQYPELPRISLTEIKALLAGIKRDLLLAREQMAKDPPGMARMLAALKAGVERDFKPSLGEQAAAAAGLQAGVNGVLTALARLQQSDVNSLAVMRDNLRDNLDNMAAAASRQRSMADYQLQLVKEAQQAGDKDLTEENTFRGQEWDSMIAAKGEERTYAAQKMETLRQTWPLELSNRVRTIMWDRAMYALEVLLDVIQFVLEIVGLLDFIPPVAIGADLLNALISLCRGRYEDAALNAVSAIPVIGWFSKGGKWFKGAAKAANMFDTGTDMFRVGKKLENAAASAIGLGRALRKADSACDLASTLHKAGVPEWLTYPLRKFGCFEAGTLVILDEDFDKQVTSQETVSHGLVLDQRAWFGLVFGLCAVGAVGQVALDRQRRRNRSADGSRLPDDVVFGDDEWQDEEEQQSGGDISALPFGTPSHRQPLIAEDEVLTDLAAATAVTQGLATADRPSTVLSPRIVELKKRYNHRARRKEEQMQPHVTLKKTSSSFTTALASRWWLLLWLTLAAGCGVAWLLGAGSPTTANSAPAPLPDSHGHHPVEVKAGVYALPIEQITVGRRVMSHNPTGEEDLEFGEDVDPATWKHLILRASKADGSWCNIELLRPDWWVEEEAAEVGGTVYIDVPECGIDGDAHVLSISQGPIISSGNGRVVTGVFRHSSANILDLCIEGLAEPIGVTGNHLFWSEDRQDFVRADSLQPNECVESTIGRLKVLDLCLRSEPTTVYNLEVNVDHTYHVTAKGVLVHNTSAADCFRWVDEAKDGRKAWAKYEKATQGAMKGKAPSLDYDPGTLGGRKYVKFDGIDDATGAMIDAKLNPFFSKKAIRQAKRQAAALRQNGLKGIWELPTEKAARAARRLLDEAEIGNIIKVRVRPK